MQYKINKLLICTLCVTTLIACKSQRVPISTSFQSYSFKDIDSTIIKDETVNIFLADYAKGKDSIMSAIIGYSETPLTKNQPESTAGNFLADAQLEGAKILDPQVLASVMNYGAIRTNYIASGPIPLSSIYEIMPFDNMLTIVEIPGTVLQQFCDHMASKGGWPIAGMSYLIKNDKAINVRINNQPLNPNIIYKVALSDYLATGGDDCAFLEPLKKVSHSIFIRDLLIEYIKRHQNINPQIEKRIENVQ